MLWLLSIIAAFVVLLITAVALPVRLRLRGQADQKNRLRLDISAFGGIAPAISVFDTAREKRKSPRKRKKTVSVRSAKSISSMSYRNIARLVVELFGRLNIVWIRGEVDFGLDDPADTGAVFGAVAPLIYTSKYAADIDLDIRPNFYQKCITGKFDAAVEVIPLRLLPPILRFGLQNFRSE